MDKGYLPDAMMNYLARLGWSLDASQEIFTRDELIEKFSLDRVNSSPASHDPDKLFWLQGEWMKGVPLAEKVEAVIPYLRTRGAGRRATCTSSSAGGSPRWSRRWATGSRPISDILTLGRYFFTETAHPRPRRREEAAPQAGRARDARQARRRCWRRSSRSRSRPLEAAIHEFAEANGIKMGDVVNPLRVATTGQAVGPGLYDCLEILGRESCRARIAATLAMLAEGQPA